MSFIYSSRFNSLQVDYQLLFVLLFLLRFFPKFQFLIGRLSTSSSHLSMQSMQVVSIPYRQTINQDKSFHTMFRILLFQFLIGRLSTWQQSYHLPPRRQFQFLIGRLSTVPVIGFDSVLFMFQFLIGRLSTDIARQIERYDLAGFNSLQVDYQLQHLFREFTYCIMFQFLIGRLSTLWWRAVRHRRAEFQFLIGRLSTVFIGPVLDSSRKVSIPYRQTINVFNLLTLIIILFQFLIGRLSTRFYWTRP